MQYPINYREENGLKSVPTGKRFPKTKSVYEEPGFYDFYSPAIHIKQSLALKTFYIKYIKSSLFLLLSCIYQSFNSSSSLIRDLRDSLVGANFSAFL